MFENLREIWRRSSAAARAGLAFGVALIVAAVIVLSWGTLRPDYQVLFSGLEPQDAASIVAELDKMKVPYRLGADETSILVNASQVHATRLKLMGKGVTLRGGVGFEIFNTTDFGVTEFAQKINYQRALQGELTRTITALDEVKTARVHLVLPESGLFRKSGAKPKASITLAMKEGRALSPEQVLGIQRLVAAAVPEIEPSAVTIADQRGVTLTRASGSDGDDAIAGRLGIKSDVEAYITKKLVALFDRAFGPGRVIVSVDATINHDQVKVTREDVLPLGNRGGEAVGAVSRARTTLSGDSGATTTAIPAAVGTVPDTTKRGTSSAEVEYLNGRRVEQVVSMPGGIKRLSVGIVLPTPADRARIDEIRQLVATTVGLNPSRGDEIAISALDLPALKNVPKDAAAAVVTPTPIEPDAASVPAVADASVLRTLVLSPQILWVAAAVLLALLVLGVVALGRRRAEPAALTPEAREATLARVRGWLRDDASLSGGRKA